jgi:hypothetical protein
VTQKRDSVGYPRPDTTLGPDAYVAGLDNGVETALTHDAGSSAPDASPPSGGWTTADHGREWLDTTSLSSPRKKLYQQLAAAGPTSGWRDLRQRKVIFLAAPAAVVFSPASPAAADVASWTDVSLASILNGAGVQDAGQNECLVGEVLLHVTVTPDAAETVGAGNAYIEFRKKGGTCVTRVKAVASGVEAYGDLWIALDTSEVFQFRVKVGGGAPSFAYAAEIHALAELL